MKDLIRAIFVGRWSERREGGPLVSFNEENRPNIHMDRMKLTDIDDVLAIERRSYTTPWSRRAFISEISENAYAHYQVARTGDGRIVGYIGAWLVMDEAHITNVAVDPRARGLGIGRLLLESVIDLADRHECERVTLEVRRSNEVAKGLYRTFGFEEVGVRKGYYTDDHEDALIMVRFRDRH